MIPKNDISTLVRQFLVLSDKVVKARLINIFMNCLVFIVLIPYCMFMFGLHDLSTWLVQQQPIQLSSILILIFPDL